MELNLKRVALKDTCTHNPNNNIMRAILFGLIVLILSSCSVQRRAERKCEKATYKWGCNKDTAYIKETVINTLYKDTVVYIKIPGDTVHDSVPVVVEIFTDGTTLVSSKKNTLQTSLATSQAWIQSGKLHHTLIQKDSVYKAQIQNAIRITQHFMKESTTKVIEVNKLTRWQTFLINSAKAFYLIIVLAVITFFALNKLVYKR